MLFTQCCDCLCMSHLKYKSYTYFHFLSAKLICFFRMCKKKYFINFFIYNTQYFFTFAQYCNDTLLYSADFVAYFQISLFTISYNALCYYVFFTLIVFFLPFIREKSRQIRERTFDNQIFRSNFALRNQR